MSAGGADGTYPTWMGRRRKKKCFVFCFVFLLHVFFYFKCFLFANFRKRKIREKSISSIFVWPHPFSSIRIQKREIQSSCTEKLIQNTHTHLSISNLYWTKIINLNTISILIKSTLEIHFIWKNIVIECPCRGYHRGHGPTGKRSIISFLPRSRFFRFPQGVSLWLLFFLPPAHPDGQMFFYDTITEDLEIYITFWEDSSRGFLENSSQESSSRLVLNEIEYSKPLISIRGNYRK